MISREQAIAMAKKAWGDSGEGWVHPGWFDDRGGALEALVNLAYAKGLEDAAKVCEAAGGYSDQYECAAAIRGTTKLRDILTKIYVEEEKVSRWLASTSTR